VPRFARIAPDKTRLTVAKVLKDLTGLALWTLRPKGAKKT